MSCEFWALVAVERPGERKFFFFPGLLQLTLTLSKKHTHTQTNTHTHTRIDTCTHTHTRTHTHAHTHTHTHAHKHTHQEWLTAFSKYVQHNNLQKKIAQKRATRKYWKRNKSQSHISPPLIGKKLARKRRIRHEVLMSRISYVANGLYVANNASATQLRAAYHTSHVHFPAKRHSAYVAMRWLRSVGSIKL